MALMNILALVPPDASGERFSKYSFLHEELQQFIARGAFVHVVSPRLRHDVRGEGFWMHSVSRTINLLNSIKSMMSSPKGNFSKINFEEKRILQKIRHIVSKHRIDVVYSPFMWPGYTAGIPALAGSAIPIIPSLRGVDVLTESAIAYGALLNPQARERITQTLTSATDVIGVSNAMIDAAAGLGVDRKKCHVILKGVDVSSFSPGSAQDARKKLDLPNKTTVLFVGHLVKRKGVDILLRASARLSKMIDHQIVICGRGPELDDLKMQAANLGIASDVRFVGQVGRSQMPDYFRACDVHVLPSLAEGSGNVICEAYASGKPVVGTNSSGIVDYIDDGQTGMLFEKNNDEDLAEKLATVLADETLARTMGKNGRERAMAKHQYHQMIDNLLGLFERAVDASRQ